MVLCNVPVSRPKKTARGDGGGGFFGEIATLKGLWADLGVDFATGGERLDSVRVANLSLTAKL